MFAADAAAADYAAAAMPADDALRYAADFHAAIAAPHAMRPCCYADERADMLLMRDYAMMPRAFAIAAALILRDAAFDAAAHAPYAMPPPALYAYAMPRYYVFFRSISMRCLCCCHYFFFFCLPSCHERASPRCRRRRRSVDYAIAAAFASLFFAMPVATLPLTPL